MRALNYVGTPFYSIRVEMTCKIEPERKEEE